MKLKNKKTGEIVDCAVYCNGTFYHSINDVFEEWEDYEEAKDFWYIKPDGCIERDNLGVIECNIPKEYYDKMVEIGNRFETEEEAEKAVEKLKAWKRLKDNGFKFTRCKRDEIYQGDLEIIAVDEFSCDDKDLDLLFGGEK